MSTSENNSPHISVNTQYIKDLSFENPHAPKSFAQIQKTPKIDVNIDLDINKTSNDNHYEVNMKININTTSEDSIIFTMELIYSGMFTLKNFPIEHHKQVLAVHCPTLMFPFARRIIASTTQDAGFQPLMIDPIDFGALYKKKITEENNNVSSENLSDSEQNADGDNKSIN